MNKTQHYVQGKWTSATGEGKPSFDAVTGEFIAETTTESDPAAAKEIFTPMLMAFAFAELLGLLAFLSLFLLKA